MKDAGASARAIAEDLLDRTGASLISGDFMSFQTCFWLPQELCTFDGVNILETDADMQTVFDRVRRYHKSNSVTEIVRHCIEAAYQTPDMIHSVHESRVVSHGQLLQKPYPVFSVIERKGEEWRVSRSDYAVPDAPALIKALSDCPLSGTRSLTNDRD